LYNCYNTLLFATQTPFAEDVTNMQGQWNNLTSSGTNATKISLYPNNPFSELWCIDSHWSVLKSNSCNPNNPISESWVHRQSVACLSDQRKRF